MKKILLINATTYDITIPDEARLLKSMYFRTKVYAKNQRIKKLDPNLNKNTRSYSIGLLRIATILKHNGYFVKYIDIDDITDNNLLSLANAFDVIAFSSVTPTIPKCAALCQTFKSINHRCIIAIGGPHINVAKKTTQSLYSCFDIYADGYDLEGAAKIVCTSISSLHPPKQYIDYSILPFPLTEYIINTFTALGCRHKCDYCQDHLIPYCENPDITGLSQFIGTIPKGTIVHYFDSNLGANCVRIKSVCKALSKINHGFLLSCDTRADTITPELTEMLETAGFVEICLGMESADINVLNKNNRNLTLDKLIKAFNIIRKHSNMYISVYNAVGIPGSTIESTAMTRKLLENLLLNDYIDEIKSCVYVPYPIDGKDYSRRGVIIENQDWAKYDRQSFPVYKLDNMTSQEIWEESINLLKTSITTWITKFGFKSIDELPEVYWIEYLSKHNKLKTNI